MATVALVAGSPGLLYEMASRLLAAAGISPVCLEVAEPAPPAVCVLVEPNPAHWTLARHYDLPVVLVAEHLDYPGVAEAVLRGAEAVICGDSSPQMLVEAVEIVSAGGTLLEPFAARALANIARANAARTVLLTPRERQIIASIAGGDGVKQTARKLGISAKTVENLQGRLYRKLGVRNRAQAVTRAYVLDLIPQEAVAVQAPGSESP